MKENFSTYAIIQICLGITLIIFSAFRFFTLNQYLLPLESLFLGIGLLLNGLANNSKDKSKRGKILSFLGLIFLITGTILFFYNTFLIY